MTLLAYFSRKRLPRCRVCPPLLLLMVITLVMASCSGLEQRPGYIVDQRRVSPSHSSRIHHLVIHYTDGNEFRSLRTLTGPRVSAHYVLPLPARRSRGQPLVYQLVDESRRAWHAGVSAWKNRSNINDTSIGIEIVNEGPDRPFGEIERILDAQPSDLNIIHWAPYPDAQMDTLIRLARDIVAHHDIDPTNVVGHADIAPSRKIDPGPLFPWYRLHQAGIGAWPEAKTVTNYLTRFSRQPPSLIELQTALAEYGYPIELTGQLDTQTRHVLRAFQMHFRPNDYRGLPDAETAAILWALLERYRAEAPSSNRPPL
ncbi:N-acetylmuramoyl-L-alanine amidase [Halomonas sp. PR-M31]|uniref:N-acetylmuramoyl-L-alanine amidase n=1 Tax=Halomonas sp. PR-M31 TaxID=1471202 RepID=UPI000AAD5399|nr:N-acetylmuramoyl-L-alanine amidase [Halomonas sp. PR-M31]